MEREAQQVVEALLKLGALEELCLPGLGGLRVKETPPYRGKNPRTGEVLDVPAKRLPVFVQDPTLAGILSDDDNDNDNDNDAFAIVTFDFADALAAQLLVSLAASPSLVLPGLGKFLIKPRGTGSNVRFVPATELVALLSSGLGK